MEVKISEKNKSISIEEIKLFEKKFNLELPDDYIDFMLKYNGGIPDTSYEFKVIDEEFYEINWGQVSEFYSLEQITEMLEMPEPKDEDSSKYIVYDYIITKNKIPIAEAAPYLPICMDIEPKNKNKVYYLELDGNYDLFQIARSFKDFINSFDDPREEFEKVFDDKNFDKLKELILNGLDPNSKFPYDHSLAEQLAGSKQIDLLKLVIEKGASKKNVLISALNGGNNYETIKYLIEIGCDVNESDYYGTPIFFADTKDIAKLLLDNGADVSIKNGSQESAIEYRRNRANYSDKEEIIKMLEEAEANFSNK